MEKNMLKRFLIRLAMLVLLATSVTAPAAEDQLVRVRMQTSEGDIVLQLNKTLAPITVENFLGYVKSGFYDGTQFHRVISNFMIQGGGFDTKNNKKQPRLAIRNEADNGLKNKRGTIAMARTGEPHSATAQFFINVADNVALDHTSPTPRGWGYAVFGKVIEGMETVDKIKQTPTKVGLLAGAARRDVPKTPIIIEKVTIETTDETGPKS